MRDALTSPTARRDPFKIVGPACISFSGGRTSAYMLRRILDAHGGTLPPDVAVTFTNTGKEREETLEFVLRCGVEWGVPIHWIEYTGDAPVPQPKEILAAAASGSLAALDALKPGEYREVGFATASRKGEPFARLIAARRCLPGPRLRFCTEVLKIRAMKWWMLRVGHAHWVRAVGLRADEPRRVANLRANRERQRWTVALPLADAGVTEPMVMAFWRTQPFDLGLQPYEGNCDACFLKSHAKRVRILEEHPEAAAWWLEQERLAQAWGATSHRFRPHGPDYAALIARSRQQRRLPLLDEDPTDLDDCACTD